MIAAGSHIKGAKVSVLGLTFKENCPDLRNSRVIDVIHELISYGIQVHVHDPVPDQQEAVHEYGVTLESWSSCRSRMPSWSRYRTRNSWLGRSPIIKQAVRHRVLVDVKAVFDPKAVASAASVLALVK